MSDSVNPIIIEPEVVHEYLENENTVLVDLCQADRYIKQHIPGAFYLDYAWVVDSEKPRMGLLPPVEQFTKILDTYGINKETHVIAYDDEGGGRACRFLWTLECIGHENISLVNGGMHAYIHSGLPLSSALKFPNTTTGEAYQAEYNSALIANKEFILSHLDDDNVVILDTRNPHEYTGSKVFAMRGGHIPGAINIEWTDAMDNKHDLKLKADAQLLAMYAEEGIDKDKTIVCHCQSHHRSAHTCITLKSLGYTKVMGYPASWSDWGNEADTPIE